MPNTSNIQSRIAHLADSGTTISGVAIAAGDVTHGLNGLKKWPAEELRAGAASLEGVELNPLHSEQSVGEVTAAGWDADEQAVVYEATLTDDKLADGVGPAGLEVSIEASHGSAGEVETDRGEAMLVSDISFTGMAIVQRGASASASAEPGEQAALSAADIHESLAGDANLASAAFDEGDLVRWETSASPGSGRVAEVVTEAGESVSANGADVTREATEDETAYKLDNWNGSEYDSGTVVKSASEILGAWEDAPEDAKMAELMDDVPDEYIFDNPGEAVEKASEMGFDGAGDEMIHSRDDGDETVFMPAPSHDELLDELESESAVGTDEGVSPESGQPEVSAGEASGIDDQPDDINAHMSDTEEELRAKLNEKDERIAELEQENSTLQDEREQVARAYASALADTDTVFDEDELVDRFEVSELAEKVEDNESATLADTEPAVQSGGGETDTEEAELSESEQAEVADHREVIADLAGKDGVAKHERQRRAELVAEKTGEDPETILEVEA